jgi:Xaa-Pro aminopeptidase
MASPGQLQPPAFPPRLPLQVASGRVFTEVEVDLELTARRMQQPGFIEPSFPTIAGAGPNGAIIHYR